MAWGRRDNTGREPMDTPEQAGQTREPGGSGGAARPGVPPEQRIAELEAERDAINDKYLRTLADYQNSQRRAATNEREARVQGVTGVVLNVLNVVDHFDLALGQDPSTASAEQIIGGVKLIRDELLRVLQNQGVVMINPGPND